MFRIDRQEFKAGDRVRLGNGETARILHEEQRNGIRGYLVKVTSGPRKGHTVGAAPGAMMKVAARDDNRVIVRVGDRSFQCRVAWSEAQHRDGLQSTPSLDPDEGLLFAFSPARAATFHMGSVAYPIDIVFVDGGRVAKVVTAAKPGSAERWTHRRCDAVVEVPGGASGARVGMPVETLKADDRNIIRIPNDEQQGDTRDNRWKGRGLPDESDPNADQMSNKHWKQQVGYDPLLEGPALRAAQRIGDPADFIVGFIEAMARESRPLDWHVDALNPALAYAVITENDIARWVSKFGLSGSAATDVHATATTQHGLQVLGDGIVLAGLADMAHVAHDEDTGNVLVLWEEHGKFHRENTAR